MTFLVKFPFFAKTPVYQVETKITPRGSREAIQGITGVAQATVCDALDGGNCHLTTWNLEKTFIMLIFCCSSKGLQYRLNTE